MKKLIAILFSCLAFLNGSADVLLWYMYADELYDINDINLVVYSDDMPRLVVDIDKNQSDDLWLHARDPRAFST